jgi:hypothetical protein
LIAEGLPLNRLSFLALAIPNVDLIERVVRVSVEIVAIVKSLLDLNEQTFH